MRSTKKSAVIPKNVFHVHEEYLIEEPEETSRHKKTKMLGYYSSDPVLVSLGSICFDLPVPGYIMVSALTVDHQEIRGGSKCSSRVMISPSHR